jgi:hypothetical protein
MFVGRYPWPQSPRIPMDLNHDTGQSLARSLVLDPAQIISTVQTLRDRIEERFPGSGLGRLASDLHTVASATVARLRSVGEPHLPLRVGVGALIVIILAMLGSLFFTARRPTDVRDVATLAQLLETIMNDLFLVGAGIFFLVTVEGRIKRRRALRFLRELRALAHIVDMHQLTKDPDRLTIEGADTPASPLRRMTRFELGRYLDYCSEMLSLISKIAALYVQNLDDPVVLGAVDEVETLTTGLSRKIWQKITVLERPGT